MPANTSPIFALTIINPIAQILPADASAYKTLRLGSANGDRIDNIIITTNDTSARVLQFSLFDGVLEHPIGEVSIPASAGTDGAVAVKGVSILNTTNFPGMNSSGSLFLQTGYSLKMRSSTTVTAAKQIDVIAFGGAY